MQYALQLERIPNNGAVRAVLWGRIKSGAWVVKGTAQAGNQYAAVFDVMSYRDGRIVGIRMADKTISYAEKGVTLRKLIDTAFAAAI